MRTTAMFVLLLAATAPAAAQSVTFHTTGVHTSVRAVIVAGENGGYVRLEPGVILASRNPDEQNLTLGAAIDADLEPGERRELVIPTFCLHSDRVAPRAGQTMEIIGRVDRDLMTVIFDARGRAGGMHQSAIWALRDGREPHGDAAALLRRLELRVKRT